MHLLLISILYLLQTHQVSSNQYSITVEVTNLSSQKGAIRLALCENPEDWLSVDAAVTKEFRLEGKENCVLTFKNIPKGTYAISLYHDENDNGAMDLGPMRIPEEAYGFSNNPAIVFGPPSFEEASFLLDKNLSLTITL
ncbi:MAG: DUF2141 domain-containing protein [Bacteroidota bacterium]